MDAAVVEVDFELGQEVEGITDGFAHGALWKVAAAVLEVAQGAGDALHHGAAMAGAEGLAEAGFGMAAAQFGFEPVEVPDLQEEEPGVLRGAVFGFKTLRRTWAQQAARPRPCRVRAWAG